MSCHLSRVRACATLLAAVVLLGSAIFSASPARLRAGAPVPETVAISAVAPLLSYQGRLLNPTTGAPLSGTITFVFRLYNVASGGAALWTETKDVVVTNGLFNTLLGDSTALPTALFNGQDLWLGIKVGADAEAAPRQRVAAVAYALYSADADLLDGQDSAFYRSAANINAGTLADARIPSGVTRDSEVLTHVLAGDGAGSGLDADLLDGQDSAFYRSATNINAGTLADARIPSGITRDTEVLTQVLAGDGAGSGLDADLLDGQDSASYRDAGNLDAGTLPYDRFSAYGDLANDARIGAAAGKVAAGLHQHSGADIVDGSIGTADLADASVTAAKVVDGTGSGLDADLLDGKTSTEFAAASHTHAMLPIAYAFIYATGAKASGSANVSSAWNASDRIYEITISGYNYYYSQFVTVVTPICGPGWSVNTVSVSGKLVVQIADTSYTFTQCGFQFVTYQ